METLIIDYFCALLIHLCLFYFFSSALTGEIKIIYIAPIQSNGQYILVSVSSSNPLVSRI